MRTGTKTVPSTWCIFNVTGHLFTFLVVLSLICLVTTQILICGNKTIWRLEILLRTIVAALLRTKCNGGFVKNKRYQETGKEYFTTVQIIVKDFAARSTFNALSCPTSPPSAPQTHTHTHTIKKDTICLMTSPHATFSPHISIFSTLSSGISKGADKENLFTDQKLFSLVIISFILMTLMCDIVGRNLTLVTLRVLTDGLTSQLTGNSNKGVVFATRKLIVPKSRRKIDLS